MRICIYNGASSNSVAADSGPRLRTTALRANTRALVSQMYLNLINSALLPIFHTPYCKNFHRIKVPLKILRGEKALEIDAFESGSTLCVTLRNLLLNQTPLNDLKHGSI